MTTPERIDSIAAALVYAASEHGTPNSFGCTELSAYGCNAAALHVGRIGKAMPPALKELLQAAGYSVAYANSRFFLNVAEPSSFGAYVLQLATKDKIVIALNAGLAPGAKRYGYHIVSQPDGDAVLTTSEDGREFRVCCRPCTFLSVEAANAFAVQLGNVTRIGEKLNSLLAATPEL